MTWGWQLAVWSGSMLFVGFIVGARWAHLRLEAQLRAATGANAEVIKAAQRAGRRQSNSKP